MSDNTSSRPAPPSLTPPVPTSTRPVPTSAPIPGAVRRWKVDYFDGWENKTTMIETPIDLTTKVSREILTEFQASFVLQPKMGTFTDLKVLSVVEA